MVKQFFCSFSNLFGFQLVPVVLELSVVSCEFVYLLLILVGDVHVGILFAEIKISFEGQDQSQVMLRFGFVKSMDLFQHRRYNAGEDYTDRLETSLSVLATCHTSFFVNLSDFKGVQRVVSDRGHTETRKLSVDSRDKMIYCQLSMKRTSENNGASRINRVTIRVTDSNFSNQPSYHPSHRFKFFQRKLSYVIIFNR